MIVIFLTSFWFLTGFLFVRIFNGNMHPTLNAVIAFPAGVSIWSMCFMIINVFGEYFSISFNPETFYIIYGLILIILFVFNILRTSFALQEIWVFFGFLVIMACSGFLADKLNVIIFGRDIFLSNYLGFEASPARGLPVFLHAFLDKRILLGREYWPFVWPTVSVSIALNLLWLILMELRRQGIFGKVSWIIAFITVAVLFSTYLIIVASFYFNHHIIATAIILIFITLLWYYLNYKRDYSTYLAMFMLFIFTLTRVEGILVSSIVLGIFLNTSFFNLKTMRRCLLIFVLPAVIWQVYLIFKFLNENDSFLSATQQFSMLILVIIYFFVFYILTFTPKLSVILNNLNLLVPAGIIITFVLLSILRPKHMFLSTFHVIQNMFSSGYWGFFWWFVLIIGLNLFIIKINRGDKSQFLDACLLAAVTSFIFILVLGGLRNPYRLQWGDSANRMLIHFTPMILFWIGAQLGYYFQFSTSVNIAKQDHIYNEKDIFFKGYLKKISNKLLMCLMFLVGLINELLILTGKLFIIFLILGLVLLTRIQAVTYNDVYNFLKITDRLVKQVEVRMEIVPEFKKQQLKEVVNSIQKSILQKSGSPSQQEKNN
ncbi:MAG: hypothetical protein ACOYVD_13725 [Bacillota bacterium]